MLYHRHVGDAANSKWRLVPIRPAHATTDARIRRAPRIHPMRPSPAQYHFGGNGVIAK